MKCLRAKNIIDINKRILDVKKITKAERHQLLRSKETIEKIASEACSGKDIHKNAARLLKDLNQKHPFSSANKRTAFMSAVEYLRVNKQKVPKKTEREQARFMIDVREGRATISSIKRWLKNEK